jgi:hypothetical protein
MLRTLQRLDAVLGALPGLIGGELLRALNTAPGNLCAYCVIGRSRWDAANADAIDFARARMAAAAQENGPADILKFLAEELRPDRTDPFGSDGVRMPYVLNAVTQVTGTLACEFHAAAIAGAPGPAAGAQTPAEPGLLVTPAGMDTDTAARLAGQPAGR